LYFNPALRLVAKYGINRSRFWVKPGTTFRAFALNTARPLFRNNRALRRAVNYAVDRAAIRRLTPGGARVAHATDQYLPPVVPGFRDVRIYPLNHPNAKRAKSLARGHMRDGKVVIYTANRGPPFLFGQELARDLEQVGFKVELKAIPPSGYFDRLSAPQEPWDIAFIAWSADYLDPYSYLNVLLDGQFVGETNYSRFNSPTYNRLLRRAARLRGRARYSAYEKLDVRLARDAAPMIALDYLNEATFVSRRVDPRCIVLRPKLDLAAICLK